MARKIKETPVLLGKNARAFDKAISSNNGKKVTSSEFKRAEDTYARIMKASKIA
ncbi:MAG: hypothetical protein KZQ88_02435 [Candidatus Thiodiazotropha sp. (ex Dulcina madagascariensis)]|nr:hypothetical protein [Candidatus Thiodiazotropha sp. (ex Dulcina madagascariensis)]MCU7927218.1 hypothetical protein [Candidatus Thiodiazotropha sp. (ex Dulcina madagascariensis)]